MYLLPSCPAHNLPYQHKSVFTEVLQPRWEIHQRDTTLLRQLRGKAGGRGKQPWKELLRAASARAPQDGYRQGQGGQRDEAQQNGMVRAAHRSSPANTLLQVHSLEISPLVPSEHDNISTKVMKRKKNYQDGRGKPAEAAQGTAGHCQGFGIPRPRHCRVQHMAPSAS